MAIVAEYQGFEFEFPDGTTDEQIYKFLQDNATQMMDNYSEPQTSELPVSPVASDLGTLSRKERPVQEVVVPEDAYTADGGINTQSDFWKGKSAIQIYEEAYGRDAQGVGVTQPESQAVSGMTENVDQKIDAETWIKDRADTFLRDNMDMTRREAMKKAEDAYQGEVAELGVDLALSLAAPARAFSSVGKAAATSGAIAGTSTAAGNVVAGRDVGEDVLFNSTLGMAAGGLIGMVGRNSSVKELQRLGTAAEDAIVSYEKKQFAKILESYKEPFSDNPEAIRDLSRVIGKLNDDAKYTVDEAATYLQTYVDPNIGAYKINRMNLPEDLRKTVVANGINVQDVITAKGKAGILVEANKEGARVGSHTLAKQVENPKMKDLITEARSGLERLASSVDKIPYVGKNVATGTGLRPTGIDNSRKEAVSSSIDNILETVKATQTENKRALYAAKEASKRNYTVDVEHISDSVMVSNEALKLVEGMAEAVQKGDKKGFKAIADGSARDLINSLNKDNAFGGVASNLEKTVQTLKTLSKLPKEGSATVATELNKHLPSLIGGLALGGPTGAAIGAGGRWAVGQSVSLATSKRLKAVEKALGGKVGIDDKARQMIEDNMAIGDVIAYLALKDIAGK